MPNMPQDGLRSVYRSFLTCDDPKGVVECKAVRKSRSKKDRDQRTKQSSSTSTSYEEERTEHLSKGSSEEQQNLPSLMTREVSRGAQKLNEVIDSWSNSTRFDKQSEHIAKDLLKGALDLEESLVMLGKLQEASQFMVKPKRRHKERSQGGVVDEVKNSNSFGENDQAVDLPKSRISSGQSSWDCYDELREVIRESFARQNLLPNVPAKEKDKDFLDKKTLDYCMDVPSTSSSHSSSMWFHPSEVEHGKPNWPNLIAKLMGLEEAPPKVLNSIMYKQLEKEKFPNQRSYLLDIDLARPRKPCFVVQKAARERRTLEEMIETMQFKGLLERSIEGSDYSRRCSDDSRSRKSLVFDDPPIVVMKPLRVPELRLQRYQVFCGINKEKPINCIQMPGKGVEEFPPSASDGKFKFPGTNGELRAGSTPQRKINKDKEGKQSEEPPVRLLKKTPDSQNNRFSSKVSHGKSLVSKVQKNGVSVKKIDNVTKVASSTKKPAEIKGAISQESSKTADLGNTTTSKLSKAARGPNVTKDHVTQSKNTTTELNMKPRSVKSSIPKKNLQKGKLDSKPSKNLVENIYSDDNLPTTIESHTQEPLKSTTSQNCATEGVNTSYGPISDNSGDASSSSHGTAVMDDVRYVEDCSCSPCPTSNENRSCKSLTNTKHLLLSSVSFLNCVKELFDTGSYVATCMFAARLSDDEMLDASIVVKCGEEILDRKCLHHAMKISPLTQSIVRRPKLYSSLEQLAGEISAEIEDLRNFSKSRGEIVLSDSIYSMLERDLCRKGEAMGSWDSGWRNGFTVDEVNDVVNDVEKLVLSELVDDVVIQLSSSSNVL